MRWRHSSRCITACSLSCRHRRESFRSVARVTQARYTLATTRSTFLICRPCRFGPVHTSDKVDRTINKVERIGNKVDRDKMSNSRCCRFVAKPATKLNVYGNSRLCCRFVAGFSNSRLSTKSTVLNSTVSPVCTWLY